VGSKQALEWFESLSLTREEKRERALAQKHQVGSSPTQGNEPPRGAADTYLASMKRALRLVNRKKKKPMAALEKKKTEKQRKICTTPNERKR